MWNENIVVPVMFEMIKHLKSKIDILEEEIKELKGE